jgi:hypothetical protein
MLRLNLASEPRWLGLGHGVRLRLAPLTTALMMAARSDPAVEALPEDAADELRALVFAKAVAMRAVLDWEGVGDAAGRPLPVTPEGVSALLDLYPLFEAFQLQYLGKSLALELEKNVCAPSPTGTSAGAIATARPARRRARTARAG